MVESTPQLSHGAKKPASDSQIEIQIDTNAQTQEPNDSNPENLRDEYDFEDKPKAQPARLQQKPKGGPKSLQEMFNKIQTQHRQRFGAEGQTQGNTDEQSAELKQTYDRKIDKKEFVVNQNFGAGASVFEETKGGEQKDETSIRVEEIEEIKQSDEFKDKLHEMDFNSRIRPENDTRIAVIGNVDSGKSTLVGVLTKSMMDDGRGSARKLVFNFSHEQANGRTSSIGQEIMGFD